MTEELHPDDIAEGLERAAKDLRAGRRLSLTVADLLDQARAHILRPLPPRKIPTADSRCTCPSGGGSLRWPCPAYPSTAEPPSIDTMAPGTTLRADTTYGTRGELFFAAADGWLYGIGGVRTNPDDIDPSTIRDVTPPAGGAGG